MKIYRLMLEGYDCIHQGLYPCKDFVSEVVNTLETTEIGRLSYCIQLDIKILVMFESAYVTLHTWPEESFALLEVASSESFNKNAITKGFEAFFRPRYRTEAK